MKRPNELQVSFYIDSKERQQFQELCKTSGVSVSNTLRMWIQTALQSQSLNVETPPDGTTVTNTVGATTTSETNHQLAVIMKRLDKVERIFNFINETELEFIKNEVIGEEFGTIRNRVGVVESQLQQMGGSISWKED